MTAQPDQAATVGGGQQGDLVPASAPGPRFRPGDQPPPVPNGNPSIHDLVTGDLAWVLATSAERDAVRELILQRKQLGLERYQSLLQAGNHRSWWRDAKDEVADFVCYLKQGIEEGRTDLEDVYTDALYLLCRVTGMDAEGGEPS